MESGAVKKIVLAMVLVVLSLLIGSQISDSVGASIGAFGIIGCLVGLFAMLWLGAECWKLIFWGPIALSIVPQVSQLPISVAAVITCLIGCYWGIMRLMGYVSFRWHFLPILDAWVFVIALYMAFTFYRHPVAINMLGMDGDMVGGKDYIICILAMFSYVVISALPWKLEPLIKCLKWVFYVGLTISLVKSFITCMNPSAAEGVSEEGGSAGEVLEKGRFSFFAAPGMKVLIFVYYRYPLMRIFSSWKKLCAMAFGFFSIVVSGWRTQLVCMMINLSFIAAVKRELTALLAMGIFAYGGLIGLGGLGTFESAPYGLQRVLSALPGIKVSKEAVSDTSESSDIRVRMWKNALDPRTGLIKDYIWGDGFQDSKSGLMRESTARMRGRHIDQQQIMERHGVWHNGWITYTHRLGVVGLVILQGFLLMLAVYIYRLGQALRRVPDGVFAFVISVGSIPLVFTSAFLVWEVNSIFGTFIGIALTKVLYCLMLERGLLAPMFSHRAYVPMTIRELEQQQAMKS